MRSHHHWPSSLIAVLAGLWLGACGETNRNESGPAGASAGGAAGTGTMAGGRAGSPGGAGSSTLGGADQAGQAPAGPPGATAEENDILAPLFDDPPPAGASMNELLELAEHVGLARGYALCRCAIMPAEPPESVTEFTGCARDEAGLFRVLLLLPSQGEPARTNEESTRCLREELATKPELAAPLRCQIEVHRQDGRRWLEHCEADPEEPGPTPSSMPCPNADELETVLSSCLFAGYCSDGTRVDAQRCNASYDCGDGSDELGCFDHSGHDMVRCGDEVEDPRDLCEEGGCGVTTGSALCDASRPRRFVCADGSDVGVEQVCDRQLDCADGTDERFCLR